MRNRLQILWLNLIEEDLSVESIDQLISNCSKAFGNYWNQVEDITPAYHDYQRWGPMYGNDWVDWSANVVGRYDLAITSANFVRGMIVDKGPGGAIGVLYAMGKVGKPVLYLNTDTFELHQIWKVEETTIAIPKTKPRQRKFEETRFVVVESELFNLEDYFNGK